jgi:hypothetical protein
MGVVFWLGCFAWFVCGSLTGFVSTSIEGVSWNKGFTVGIGSRLKRDDGFFKETVARFARASSIGAGVLPNVTGRTRVAWRVAGVVDWFVE